MDVLPCRFSPCRLTLHAPGAAARYRLYCPVPLQEHQRYHELLVAEEVKRRALLDIVYSLEVQAGRAGVLSCMHFALQFRLLLSDSSLIHGSPPPPPPPGVLPPPPPPPLWVFPPAAAYPPVQNDKRQLETALVVEGTTAAAIKRTSECPPYTHTSALLACLPAILPALS